MALFSERNGYIQKPVLYEAITPALRNRIWNTYQTEIVIDSFNYDTNYLLEIMDSLGLAFINICSFHDIAPNLSNLSKWYNKAEWYRVFDFIEIYLSFLPKTTRKTVIKNYNDVFSWENSGYRIVDTTVLPITNENELQTIASAQNTKYMTVSIHIQKAAELFAKRPNPDYENSIKESISAIEALCCLITNEKKSTLGEALKKIEKKGIVLHSALKKAIISLYGYTSDEGGIQHGSIDFVGASYEDAKFMLVSCSAFVNYIIEKWQKVT